jgi:hypothetical protein
VEELAFDVLFRKNNDEIMRKKRTKMRKTLRR